AVECVGGQSGRAAHFRDGMKHLKDQRMRINQIYASARAHRHNQNLQEEGSPRSLRKGYWSLRRLGLTPRLQSRPRGTTEAVTDRSTPATQSESRTNMVRAFTPSRRRERREI